MMLAVMLEMRGRRAVLVGGGAVASRRAATLLEAGMRVTVIAPTVCAALMAQDVTVTLRPYLPGDLSQPEDLRGGELSSDLNGGEFGGGHPGGVALVVACTDSPEVNDRVTADALALGLPVNHAGAAERGSLRFPLSFVRGGVGVSLSTGRELPMLSQALRDRLLGALPETLPLDRWSGEREAALQLPAQQREAALQLLRADIRRTVGVGA